MSYPERTAFFCSSIFILSRSVILRLMVLMASVWSILRICKLTITPVSKSRMSASIRSLSSGARISRKDTAPIFRPMRKYLPSPNRKEDGAIKSFVVTVPGICVLPENLPSPSVLISESFPRPFPVHAVSFLPVLSNNTIFVLHSLCYKPLSFLRSDFCIEIKSEHGGDRIHDKLPFSKNIEKKMLQSVRLQHFFFLPFCFFSQIH